MTSRQLYIDTLIELDKVKSPHISLVDFLSYANNAVTDVVDEIYIDFEITQRSVDLIKQLKQFLLLPNDNTGIDNIVLVEGEFENSLKMNLPDNYRALTNLIITFITTGSNNICKKVGDKFSKGAKKVDSDTLASIISDPFQKPNYREPKFSIIGGKLYIFTGELVGITVDSIQMDYLKTPAEITLTYEQTYEEEDNSQVLEFDNIMINKIRKRIVQKLMERAKDPRLTSYSQINQLQPQLDVNNKNLK